MNKGFIFWLLVIPASFVVGVLCLIPFHLMLYFTFENGSVVQGADTSYFERFLSPFIISFASVLAGRLFVATDRHEASKKVFKVYLLLWLVMAFMLIFDFSWFGIMLTFSWQFVVALLGSILGLLLSIKIDKWE